MVRTPLIAAALFALVTAMLAVSPARPFLHRVARHFGLEAPPRVLGAGDRLDGLNVQLLRGDRTTIGTSDGRIRVINVFATWCTECRTEIPSLSALAPKLAKQGVDVIGIDQQETPQNVGRFASQFGIHYPIYVDNDGTTRQVLGARVIPTTVIVDGKGIIRFVRVGALSASDVSTLVSAARGKEE